MSTFDDGRWLLIEGLFYTCGGLRAAQVVRSFPPGLALIAVDDLSGRPLLWGDPVSDERYLIAAGRSA